MKERTADYWISYLCRHYLDQIGFEVVPTSRTTYDKNDDYCITRYNVSCYQMNPSHDCVREIEFVFDSEDRNQIAVNESHSSEMCYLKDKEYDRLLDCLDKLCN